MVDDLVTTLDSKKELFITSASSRLIGSENREHDQSLSGIPQGPGAEKQMDLQLGSSLHKNAMALMRL